MSWPQPTISGYNATPPADDGSQTASNVVAWATILAKIGNPLKTLLESTISSIAAYLVPTGATMTFAGTSTPSGWLLCYGQTVSRSTFADLFAVIGTTYGAGDGSTTFNVPDFRGRAAIGLDNMGGSPASRITASNSGITGTTLGATGGDERLHGHAHTGSTVGISDPGHNHTQNSHGHSTSDPGHVHAFNSAGSVTTGTSGMPPGSSTGVAVTTGVDNTAVTGVSVIAATATNVAAVTGITATPTIATSGAGATQNVQPSIVQNWIITT